jgi:hypothetical protein
LRWVASQSCSVWLNCMNIRVLKPVVGLSTLFLTMILAPAAYADQCASVSKGQAIAALNNLRLGQTIYQLCEPCGERTPKPIVIRSLSVSSGSSAEDWSVKVNGSEIDLAYIYIDYNKADTRQRVNLAVVSTCPARNITPILSVR